MKRRGFTLWEALAVVAIIGIVAAILYPVFARFRENPGHRSCQSNLKRIALGSKQYLQDYDEFYPRARNSGVGLESPDNWAGELQPYLKSSKVFQCPSDEYASDTKKNSYGYNARLSKMEEKEIHNSMLAVLNFEVIPNPDNWTQTGRSPEAVSGSTRHLEGSNFSFVDGHVKWYRPGNVKADVTQKSSPTFAIR